ncbi:MAG TPA: branched-chain amino acid ABC transporter permease, partial [Pyrinomonadaceae bacterium]
MPTFIKRILGLVIVVVILVGANAFMGREGLFGFGLPYYYAEILNLTGIGVILAVSLNLITGFTGQFSIGHAGFMAVGAYSSVFVTVYYSEGLEQWLTSLVGATVAQSFVFLLVIIVGALVAALAGLVVGIPSLRLRGDYLAIVTLGFAEIIRIVILNIDAVGGATGYTMCVYESSAGVPRLARPPIVIPAGGTCGKKPCWKRSGPTGFRYKNRARTPDGVDT